jgi:predicted transcriptional regulator
MATTKTTIYLDADDYQRLQKLARERGQSAALLVREAIAEYTAARVKVTKPKSVGMGRSGRTDVGSRAEQHLKGFGATK